MSKIFLPIFLVSFLSGFSQNNNAIKYSEEIETKGAFRHLSSLASDEFEGRETGKRGGWMAADYIAKQFRKLDLKPLSTNSYHQKVPVKELSVMEAPAIINGSTYSFLKDFYFIAGVERFAGRIDEITFCGFGIEDKNYNDYAGIDVKDKVVLIIGRGLPGENFKSWTFFDKIENLQKKQPSLIIACDTAFVLSLGKLTNLVKNSRYYFEGIKGIDSMAAVPFANESGYSVARQKGEVAPILYVSEIVANQFLAKSTKAVKSLIEEITSGGKPKSFSSKVDAEINLSSNNIPVKADNVIGLVEGTDLKDEVIVISGHYDHLGMRNGKIYNGADDNASGISGLLEIAQGFSKARKKGKAPRRSILFIAFVGEEKGLLGSAYYTSKPVYALEKTVANLNIDMIGRNDLYRGKADSLNYLFVIGSDKISTELRQINETANNMYTRLALNYKYDDPKDQNYFYYRSDHFNFAKHGIPVIFYFNGTHKDYHQESDETNGIKIDLLVKRAKLVFFTAWEIANRGRRLVIDKK
jgi:hypothetical protein